MDSTNNSKPFWQRNLYSKITLLVVLIVLIFLVVNVSNSKGGLITVHVIPHTHDDAGWLDTFDGYYKGRKWTSNCVECILDTMVSALSSNRQRTFTYTEISFFEKWYTQQSEKTKLLVKTFVEEKRLEFLSGGWVMNDEADPYYQHIIDQIRLGMQFLKKEFNVVPKVAWYLDPFGHSLTNAYLMNKLGYENLVIVRIDWRDKEKRISQQKMEFMWKPYNQIDKGKNSILTHITYGHYNPESEFPYMLDTTVLSESSIRYKLSDIYSNISKRRDAYGSDELMFLFGDDFTFGTDAPFKNMDTLMKLVSEDPNYNKKMRFVYSTPIKYFDSIRSKKNLNNLPTYEDKDFFPYADGFNEYWTGYFTSRPYLKGIIRDSGNYLAQSSKFVANYIMKFYSNLAFEIKNEIIGVNNNNYNNKIPTSQKAVEDKKIFEELMKVIYKNFDTMRRELGIAQHHDAVTGTARNDVSDDYIYRLGKGITALSDSVKDIILKENFIKSKNDNKDNMEICLDSIVEKRCVERIFSEEELSSSQGIVLSVINPGIKDIYPKFVKIKVDGASKKSLKMKEIIQESSSEIDFDLFYETEMGYYVVYFLVDFKNEKNLPHINFSLKLKNNSLNKKSNKTFDSDLISKRKIKEFDSQKPYVEDFVEAKTMKIYSENGYLRFEQTVFNENSSKKFEDYIIELAHGYYDYRSYSKNCQGAYMMDTNKENPDLYKIDFEKSFIAKGKNVTKINLKFDYSSIIIKLYPKIKEKNFTLDVQSVLHKYEPSGQKEFMLITKSNIDNTNDSSGNTTEFYTDTNGMRVVKRIKGHRDTFSLDSGDSVTAGNFYPIGSVLYIKDKNTQNKNLYIFNDRSQGGSSIHKGEILFDISRWGDRDDRRGLSDGIYEYQSSRSHFGINHIIAFSDIFDKDNVFNYMQNKPLSVIYKDYVIEKSNNGKRLLNEKDFNMNALFKISDEKCFVINYYIVNEKKILFQFYNKSDPYYKEYDSCWVRVIRNELFKVKTSQLNGVELRRNRNIPSSFLKKRFFAPLDDLSENMLYEKNIISAQEFYTLVLEFE